MKSSSKDSKSDNSNKSENILNDSHEFRPQNRNVLDPLGMIMVGGRIVNAVGSHVNQFGQQVNQFGHLVTNRVGMGGRRKGILPVKTKT